MALVRPATAGLSPIASCPALSALLVEEAPERASVTWAQAAWRDLRLDFTYQPAPRATMSTPNTVNSTVPMPPVSGRSAPFLFSILTTGTVTSAVGAEPLTVQDSSAPVVLLMVALMVTLTGSESLLPPGEGLLR